MDQKNGTGRRRLPGYTEDRADEESQRWARTRRDDGVRQVRRLSNWTAAALVAGVAATTGYFAHAATVAAPAASYTGPTSQGQAGTTVTGHKAAVTHPVVTSGGSGVTAGSSGLGGTGGSGSRWRDN